MKSILITGSSQGIGKGIANHFAKLGYFVFVTYKKNKELGMNVVTEIGENSQLLELDVTNEESVKKAFEIVTQKIGVLDVLVNNAAVDFPSNIETCNFEEWQEITRTKIDGNFLCTKYALPLLKKSENPNIIVMMSSMFEKVDPDDPAYCVGTGGTVAFMKAMALSLAKYKIRVNGVGPSETRTNSKYWTQIGSDDMWDDIQKLNPLGKLCTPEDVANTIELVVNDKSKFINGNIIYVTGGNHLK